jgi:hypothetical protein
MRFPYAEVEFTSEGALHDPDQQREALDLIRDARATDVLVLAHGWNSDMPAARRLFRDLGDSIDRVRARVPGARRRRLAIVGALWPSVRWADDDDLAGGGAGVVDEAQALLAAIDARVDDDEIAAELASLVPRLEASAEARRRFLELLRELLPEVVSGDEDPPPEALVDGDPQTVFDEASVPEDGLDAALAGDGFGGAADLGGGAATVAGPGFAGDEVGAAAGFSFGGVLRGARSLLNLTTYYTMKARAGDVGVRGVAPLLEAIAATVPEARIHLAGHSFGARVVAAATAATTTPVHTLAFLQGAFSHHALAADYDGRGNDGFFRAILAPEPHVRGPVVVTHTSNDRAVGVAYAVASRLARQRAAGVGGPGDIYGGIGRNGALRTPEVVTPAGALLEVGARYDFRPGRIHNLRADRFIRSHSAVTGREVAYALLTAMATEP